MASIDSLKALYIEELQDLWSANDQMVRALKKIAANATNEKLRSLLQNSEQGVAKHTELIRSLLDDLGAEQKKEHCKGMEGLAAEAIKHAVTEAPANEDVRDAAIIAQYQRMTHYGITGFGTVAAFAKVLKLQEHASKLAEAVGEIESSDDLMTSIAERAVNVAAADS